MSLYLITDFFNDDKCQKRFYEVLRPVSTLFCSYLWGTAYETRIFLLVKMFLELDKQQAFF